jgi:hypothetical protein
MGRIGGEARGAGRVPRRGPGASTWAGGGDFDADRGFGLDGVGRPAAR